MSRPGPGGNGDGIIPGCETWEPGSNLTPEEYDAVVDTGDVTHPIYCPCLECQSPCPDCDAEWPAPHEPDCPYFAALPKPDRPTPMGLPTSTRDEWAALPVPEQAE